MPSRQATIPDALFPCTELGIPMLLDGADAKFVEAPIRAWGSISRKASMRGTWLWYVDDYKFSTLFRDPSQAMISRAKAFVEPNYTLGDQMPYPVALYRIYQKRWISRFLQEQGLYCFVDLFVPREWWDLNLEGVPSGWGAFATVGADTRLDELDHAFETACRFAQGAHPVFLIWGGGERVAAWSRKHYCVHVKHPANEFRKGVDNG